VILWSAATTALLVYVRGSSLIVMPKKCCWLDNGLIPTRLDGGKSGAVQEQASCPRVGMRGFETQPNACPCRLFIMGV
jgi:hypothetical protein